MDRRNKPPRQTEFMPGTLEMLILKTLTLEPQHGYGIASHIWQTSAELLRVEEGSLYPALQRLQLKGLVTSEWRMTPNNRRARYYKLTAAGRRELAREVEQYERVIQGIARVLGTS
jgi:PadR family transcriptional regulator PadR